MDGLKSDCPYCRKYGQLLVLRCCFGVICSGCYIEQLQESKHECPCPEQFQPVKQMALEREDACQRCTQRHSTIVCLDCSNQRFCQECFDELHNRQKFAIHKWTAILHQHHSELECQKHNKQRNLLLENCSLACVKCAEELRLRKVSVVDDKENICQTSEYLLLLATKRSEALQSKQLAEEKWKTIQMQFQHDFSEARDMLARREKESTDVMHCMREQELQMYEELISAFDLCSRTLEVYNSAQASNPLIKKLAKYKRALTHELLKKHDKKKTVYESYDYRAVRPNLDALENLVKSLGSIDKSKIQKEEEPQSRSTIKLKNITVCDNRIQPPSNRKRSVSKDVLNISNISARKENTNPLHQRVKSTNRIDAEERRGLSRMPKQPPVSKARDRSIITLERGSIGMQSTEGLERLNVNLFNQKNVSQVTSQATSQLTSQYSTNNGINNSLLATANQPSASSLVPEMKAVKEEKFKNEFLHLRESMKKNSSYFGQHRPSLRK